MKTLRERMRKVTPLSAAGYFFVFALAAKGVFLYAHHHPRESMRVVDGIVTEARLGGNGASTSFRLKTPAGTHRYSSYFGKVWPGMERIETGDTVRVLAERDRLGRNQIITGRHYYIWEIVHDGEVVVAFDDVREQVEKEETRASRFANVALGVSTILLMVVWLRRYQSS